MDEMMNGVSVQIQRAIIDAISSQVLPQIQNAIMAGLGHVTQKGWNVPAEGAETKTEVLRNEKDRNTSKFELVHFVPMTDPRTLPTTKGIREVRKRCL